MSDYVLRGTERLVSYHRTLNVPVTKERLAAAIGIPVGVLSGNGRPASSYVSPKYNEAKAQALAILMGVEPSDVTTNGGQQIVG